MNKILLPVRKNKKGGYIDSNGDIIIDLTYDFCSEFGEGLAYVSKNNRKKFINHNEESIIECVHEYYDVFNEGLCFFQTADRKYGCINTQGQTIIPPRYDNISRFSDGMAVATLSGKYGFIDKTGKVVIGFSFDHCFNFEKNSNFTPCLYGKKWGVIDKKGDFIIKAAYEYMSRIVDNSGFAVNDTRCRYIKISPNGEILQKGKDLYQSIRSFREGYAAVCVNDKWGFIDDKGNQVIPYIFDDAWFFSEGLCAVNIGATSDKYGTLRGGKYGYIDKDGKIIIEPNMISLMNLKTELPISMMVTMRIAIKKPGTLTEKENGSGGQQDKDG